MRDPTALASALASALEAAAAAVEEAETLLMPVIGPDVPANTVMALVKLAGVRGQLQGMADALRMAEARDA